MSTELFWILGSDEHGRWHQRIARAPSAQRAQQWWCDSLGRDPEVLLEHSVMEQAVSALTSVQSQLPENIFGVWVRQDNGAQCIIVEASTPQHACAQLPQHTVLAVVSATPLLEVVARLRSVVAGETPPDEKIR